MNRSILFWGAVLIIVIAAFGIWYSYSTIPAMQPTDTNATSSGAASGTDASPSSTSTNGSSSTNTFRSIFSQSGNNECSYDLVTANSKTHNVIDIADGKMHGEFRTTGAVNTADLMTYSGGVLYVWKEGATTGKKTNITSVAQLPDAIPTDLTSGAVLGSNVNSVSWDCHAWNKDTSVFSIPSYVTFNWS